MAPPAVTETCGLSTLVAIVSQTRCWETVALSHCIPTLLPLIVPSWRIKPPDAERPIDHTATVSFPPQDTAAAGLAATIVPARASEMPADTDKTFRDNFFIVEFLFILVEPNRQTEAVVYVASHLD